ncbi:MAG: DUF6273 domain-containing protein [Coriobacteriales bacterium]|nr:DUF6273 domain-containing protein [Coriobacteriales bacterium]
MDGPLLYLTGSPVLILATTLLKDAQTGAPVAQARFKSVSSRTLSALTIEISAQDAAGRPLQENSNFQYRDLRVVQGDEFGGDTSIPLPDARSSSVCLTVREALFDDGSSWEAPRRARWESIPPQQSLQEVLGDEELLDMYRINTSMRAHLVPGSFSDLWFCACGAVNRSSDETCFRCGLEFTTATHFLSRAVLEEERAWYREGQQHARERAEQRVRRRKRAIRYGSIAASLLVIAIAALLLFFGIVRPTMGKEALENPSVGDTVYFGDTYWQVLDVQNGRALLITQDILERRPYDDEYVDTTWEACSLRAYLNGDFLNAHFSADEEGRIALTKLVNADNPEYGTPGGNETQDRVFLLSIEEAQDYFSSDAARQAKQEGRAYFWCLRSPGSGAVPLTDILTDTDVTLSEFADHIVDNVAFVGADGSIDTHGVDTTIAAIGIRPALWLNVGASGDREGVRTS